ERHHHRHPGREAAPDDWGGSRPPAWLASPGVPPAHRAARRWVVGSRLDEFRAYSPPSRERERASPIPTAAARKRWNSSTFGQPTSAVCKCDETLPAAGMLEP